MATAPKQRRKYFTKARKMEILRELESSDLSPSDLARKHDTLPVTVHSWKRTLRENMKKPEEIDIAELLKRDQLKKKLLMQKKSLKSSNKKK